MSDLVIAWEYLTGYAVATDHADRERAEWPPHPARVFMALAAAWFETGEDPAEGAALRWLERLGDPELQTPTVDPLAERTCVTCFVPVNDQLEASNAPLQSVPSLTRVRQPRTFPRVWVGDEACRLRWTDVPGTEEHRAALDRLCRKVTRIGHSSSVVAMWIDTDPTDELPAGIDRWSADDTFEGSGSGIMLRSGGPGTLDRLAACVDTGSAKRAAELDELLPQLEAERKAIKGSGAKELRAEVDARLRALRDERALVEPRPPQRPSTSRFTSYRRTHRSLHAPPSSSCFSDDLIVLTGSDEPQPSLVSTFAAARALRDMLMKLAPQPVPSWISGHAPDGEPNRSDDGCHLACLPLAHVGHRHADGGLLGMAIAIPASLDRKELATVLRSALVDPETRGPRALRLLMGRFGTWTIARREPTDSRLTVQSQRWTAAPDGAVIWASVTPVVLDRYPKADRVRDGEGWRNEVATIVAAACTRIQLPEPDSIDIDTTSFVRGAPRAVTRQHRLRSGASRPPAPPMRDGDGFPAFPSRGTAAPRPQVHVRLRFTEPVVGPVLLGVGRHHGYGLCMPLPEAGR